MSRVIEMLQHDLAMREGELARALMAIERVRELHAPTDIRGRTPNGVEYSYTGCMACWEQTNDRDDRTFDFSHVEYPCETIRVLDGDADVR